MVIKIWVNIGSDNGLVWCLTTPSHYLNQRWKAISEVLWYSHEDNFTGNAQDFSPWYDFQNYHKFIITAASPRGWVTHIYISNLSIIGSDNGLSPGQCQAIIWTNDGILLIRPLGTKFIEILIAVLTVSFKKMCLKGSVKCRPLCVNGII